MHPKTLSFVSKIVFSLFYLKKRGRSNYCVSEIICWKDGRYMIWFYVGKMKDPEFHQYITPHSCGEVCGRQRDNDCPHHCNILCHPGPCPPCQAFTTKSCACGKTKQSVKCATAAATRCDKVCERTRNCGKHSCQSVCHSGPCDPCSVTITQVIEHHYISFNSADDWEDVVSDAVVYYKSIYGKKSLWMQLCGKSIPVNSSSRRPSC